MNQLARIGECYLNRPVCVFRPKSLRYLRDRTSHKLASPKYQSASRDFALHERMSLGSMGLPFTHAVFLMLKPSNCQLRPTIPWATLPTLCLTVFLFSSSNITCKLRVPNGTSWQSQHNTLTHFCLSLFSLGVSCCSLRIWAPKVLSSMHHCAQLGRYACDFAAVTRPFCPLSFPDGRIVYT